MDGQGHNGALEPLNGAERGGVRSGLPAAAGASVLAGTSFPSSPSLCVTRHLTPTIQAYRTGQKQRLFYSAKLHPELATTHTKPGCPDNPSNSRPANAGGASDLFFASLSPAHRKTSGSKRAAEKELVISYCANVMGDWPAPADYTPRFLRVVLRRSEDAEREGSSEVAAAGRQGDL